MMPITEQPNKLLRVFVLGRFEVEQGGHLIESEQWRSGKARSLFKIMLTRRGFQISRQEVAELLWPELDQDRAANNLHQAVYSLRRTFEPERERASASIYLKSEGAKLQLNPALIAWIDLEQFKQLFRQAELTGDLVLYEQAEALYGGDYLPEDLYEDWSVYRREALRQDWITLQLHMATLYQARGQDEKYYQCLRRVLESDFSHEESVQKLMQALVEKGRREEAVTLYHNFATKLNQRLNIKPLDETQQLYHNILTSKTSNTKNLGPEPKIKEQNIALRMLSESPLKHFPELGSTDISASSTMLTRTAADLQRRGKSKEQVPEAQLLAPKLIGRLAEQRRWQHSLNEALQGYGSLTLLMGEAGIGKTYLAHTLAEQAELVGFQVIYTTCSPEQADLPFSTFSILLQQTLGHLKKSELEECLHCCNPELYRLLPDLPGQPQESLSTSHQLQEVTEETPTLERNSAGRFNREGVFVAMAQVLTWMQRKQPLVLVLDDLQYLPSLAVQLLRYLLTYPMLRSLVILSTLRPINDGVASPELGRLVNWATETAQITQRLERLKPDEIQQLLTSRLNLSLRASLVELVNQNSWGNPRLALELLNDWYKEGYLRLIEGQWEMGEIWNGKIPPSVTLYIKRLVANLSNNAQVLLRLAALIATTFPKSSVISPLLALPWNLGSRFGLQKSELSFNFEMLRQILLHRSDGAGWWIDLDKTRLGQTLTELTDQKLIEEEADTYRFTYPLLAETLVASLPYNQRQCWQEVISWAQKKMENGLASLEGYNYDQN
ncbi:MAG: AAA family ATPase [Chloroflexota bacterium]|nr:AAA family ATPase [Chloroflexota bacterium]